MASKKEPNQLKETRYRTADLNEGRIGQLLRVNRPTPASWEEKPRWKSISKSDESKTLQITAEYGATKANRHTFEVKCELCANGISTLGLGSRRQRPIEQFHCRHMEPPNSMCLGVGAHPRARNRFPPGKITSTTYVKHYNRLRYMNAETRRLIRIDARVQRVEIDGSIHEYALAGVNSFNDAAGEDLNPWNYGEPTDTLLGLYLNLNDEDNAANSKFLSAVPPTLVDTLDVTGSDDDSNWTMTAFGYDGTVVATGSWPDLLP